MKNMQKHITRGGAARNGWWIFPVLLFVLLVSSSCGGGAAFLAGGGIGGTGVISFGPITGLGSIFVNNIEYETTSATVTMDGFDSDESQLQVGMVVRVEGTVNADGRTGIANVVIFDDNVEGPVNAIDVAGKTLQVMGQTVLVDDQTVFAGLPYAWSLADLIVNDTVEVSGLQDIDGNIKATRLFLKAAGELSEVSGQVANLTGASFTINALTVDYSTAILENFSARGIQPGDMVEVKGTFDQTILRADTVKKKSGEFNNNDELELTGFISARSFDGPMLSGFTMITPAGIQQVRITAATNYKGGLAGDLTIGALVEVEGSVLDNVVQARTVEIEDNARVEAVAISHDSASLTVGLASLSALSVTLHDHADLEDRREVPVGTANPAEFVNSIRPGDLLVARGRLQPDGELLVGEVALFDPPRDASAVTIQGPLQDVPHDPWLEMLGVTVDTGPAVQFLDGDENTISRSVFFGLLGRGTLVNVEGDLTADNRIDGLVLQISQPAD